MISIIITCYNVAPFVAEALSSVLAIEGIEKEIIVIDDASHDNTMQIVDSIATLYPDVRFKTHRFLENTPGGVASAANYGLSVAEGEYVAFLDGDDWLYPASFLRALERLEREKCDFVMVNSNEFQQESGDFSWFEDQGAWANFSPRAYMRPLITSYLKGALIGLARWRPLARRLPSAIDKAAKQIHSRHFKHFSLRLALSPAFSPNRVFTGDAAKRALFQMGPFPWRKIYRRDFIEQNGLSFPEGNWMFEDNPFHWQAVLVAKSFILHDEITYSHRIWTGQTIAKASSGALAIFDHALTIFRHMERHDPRGAFRDAFTIWLADHTLWAYMSVRIEDKARVFERAREVCDACGLDLVAVMRKASIRTAEYHAIMSAYILPSAEAQFLGKG